ncbi:MAG: ATP-binding protein [Pseudomonadota bacterium]
MVARRFSTLELIGLGALYVLAPAVVLLGLYFVDRPDSPPPDHLIQPTFFQHSFVERPPVSGWRDMSVDQPRGRDETEPFTSIWYQLPLEGLPENPALLVVFPHAMLDVWRNDQRLYSSGEVRQPLRYERMPIIVPIGGVSGGDRLTVRMSRQSSWSGLGARVYITTAEQALRTTRSIRQIHLVLPWLILAFMAAFGIAVGLMYFLRPSQTAYGWYALMVTLWGLKTWHLLVESVPFLHFLWFSLGFVLLLWLVAELYFVNRYFAIDGYRAERWVSVISVVGLAVFVILALKAQGSLGFEILYFNARVVLNLWFLLVAFYIASRYFVAIRQRADFDSVSLWVASGVVVGVGIRDILFEQSLPINIVIPGTTYYLQYAVVVPLGLFGVQLVRRFVRDSRLATLRNEELNQLVDARTRALEHSYKKLGEEERLRVLAEERARLMRDMHDGLGGQLVHALALSERADDPDLQRSLRLALDDLRLIVDSLSPSEDGLQDLLASYRHRISKLLQRQNIDVEWHIDDDVATPDLRPDAALSILRILQEAVTNAVRHADCDRLIISLSQNADILVLSVADNGCGMPEDVTEHGINNMRVRANEIRAQVQVKSSPGSGTKITLLIPLEHTV